MRLLLIATLAFFFVDSAVAQEAVHRPRPNIADGSNVPRQGSATPATMPPAPAPTPTYRQPLGHSVSPHGHSGHHHHDHYHGHGRGVTVYRVYTPGYYSTFGYTVGYPYPVYAPHPPGYMAYPYYYRPRFIAPPMVIPRW